jgi:hypothetical protein
MARYFVEQCGSALPLFPERARLMVEGGADSSSVKQRLGLSERQVKFHNPNH